MSHPIYLDNAATSYPKPASVLRAVTSAMRDCGGNPGRGAHRHARAASELLYECRKEVAELIRLDDPTHVVFTQNTTAALNIALKGFLRAGDHVLISDMEHNAVRRPILARREAVGISYSIFPTEGMHEGNAARILSSYKTPATRAVIALHASNICSRTLPLKAIGSYCRQNGLLFIADAAQSIGHLPIDLDGMGITALCAPGHKGLFGPQGSGFLALSSELSGDTLPRTLIEGGSGYDSFLPSMPADAPERYEAGTVATPCIAGLLAGIRFVQSIGLEEIREKEEGLFRLARERLQAIRGVHVYEPHAVGSVLSFSVEGRASEEIAALLDKEGISVRAGFHCAPLAHRTLGTEESGGTVRLGFGYFNTPEEVRRCTDRLYRVMKG